MLRSSLGDYYLTPTHSGDTVTVRTDHNVLRRLMNHTESSGQQTMWRLQLAKLDFTIEYRPGRVLAVRYALSRLFPTGAPPQTVHNEIPSFDDPLLLLRLHATYNPVPTPSPTVESSSNDVSVLISTHARQAHTKTDPAPLSSSSGIPTGPTDVNKLGEVCWDDTDDVDPFHIERAADGPT